MIKKTPIICIAGKSESGKTTLIEKLIPELKKRGYSIGSIKHQQFSLWNLPIICNKYRWLLIWYFYDTL
jgi:uridine kinase